jgi:hypothetical protein
MSATNETTVDDGFTTVEVWVMVDEKGNWVVHPDRAELLNRYDEEIGTYEGEAVRIIKATIKVPTPKPVELSGVVAAEVEGGELVAK